MEGKHPVGCTYTGTTQNGQSYIEQRDSTIWIYGLPAELLPDCARCNTPTVIDGRISGKYFYCREFPLKKIWCHECVPLWVRVLDATSPQRRKQARLIRRLANRYAHS